MNVNFEFLIVAYIISMSVDWILQHQVQAKNKSNFHKEMTLSEFGFSLYCLITHSWVYALFTAFTLFLIFKDLNFFLIYPTLFISHAIIDSRIPVKWIMKLKGMSKEEIEDYNTYGFMHIGIDHRLHELVLLGLAFIV